MIESIGTLNSKSIGRLNAAIYRNMQMFLSRQLADMNIKSGQYDFFLVISLAEGISQKELSEYLYIGKSTTAKAVKNLVSMGYVFKENDKKDRRVDRLYLTDLGREKTSTVQKIFEENVRVASKGLSDEELTTLAQLLERVQDNLIAENGGVYDK